ncbi:hypothetical protein CDD83_444 [Cordyceps sp. RAO-2017]|nr:hypothetical protein CDD83_444 [Cordyceps sp. RAO-2017]
MPQIIDSGAQIREFKPFLAYRATDKGEETRRKKKKARDTRIIVANTRQGGAGRLRYVVLANHPPADDARDETRTIAVPISRSFPSDGRQARGQDGRHNDVKGATRRLASRAVVILSQQGWELCRGSANNTKPHSLAVVVHAGGWAEKRAARPVSSREARTL